MKRPVEQIAEWLEALGLGQYAKLFADNDIDVSVLPHLTDHDLKDLGVSLGHRRFSQLSTGALRQSNRSQKPSDRKNRNAQIPPNAVMLPCSSRTWWARQPYPLVSTLKICAT